MQQLLYVGGAAALQLASLFKCEIAGRFKILSVLLLDRSKPKMVSTIVPGSRIENISEQEMKMRSGGGAGTRWWATEARQRVGMKAKEKNEREQAGRAKEYVPRASIRQEANRNFKKAWGGKL